MMIVKSVFWVPSCRSAFLTRGSSGTNHNPIFNSPNNTPRKADQFFEK